MKTLSVAFAVVCTIYLLAFLFIYTSESAVCCIFVITLYLTIFGNLHRPKL